MIKHLAQVVELHDAGKPVAAIATELRLRPRDVLRALHCSGRATHADPAPVLTPKRKRPE